MSDWISYVGSSDLLVAGIVADFVEKFDAARERCWIAEKDGAVVGSAFVVRHSDAVAKLRPVYVVHTARGLGIGTRLVAQAIPCALTGRASRRESVCPYV